MHRVPPVPASPSCLAAALQNSQQLLPVVGVVEAWPGAFPGLQGAEGLGRGEQGHPSPCLADKPGPARRKEVCWALQGAASGAGTSVLPGLLACCTWACGTSGPGRAEAARLRCVWAAAGPLSPLGRVSPAWWGLRKRGCADSGRKPPSTELRPARAGAKAPCSAASRCGVWDDPHPPTHSWHLTAVV